MACKYWCFIQLSRLGMTSPHFRNITYRFPVTRPFCTQVRTENDKKEKNVYSHTVNLPCTKFPLWVKPHERAKLDEKILNEYGFSELYSWQRENFKHNPEFILHDGPPYANGSPHIGHAVNKILKDITNRSNLLKGKKVQYVPGWDCHGLPIELKAVTSKDKNLSILDIRRKARDFAMETIKSQKSEFKSWGVLADWKDNCYHTFDKAYIKNQINQFYKLYCQDFIYRDLKPVYFSPSSRTALAESELEYNTEHVSKSIYLKVRLSSKPSFISNSDNIYLLIWTTTPWSLPANQFIAYNPELEYSLVIVNEDQLIIAKCLVESLSETFKVNIKHISDFPGLCLEEATYVHPLENNHNLKLFAANFVSSSKGTGLVHCAPAHGQDDFLLALKNEIPLLNLVDDHGKYSSQAGDELKGLNVLTDGRDKVLKLVEKDVLFREDYKHSYPYDWRTKKPVILKASRQWFIDTNRIKSKALECLETVNFIPVSFKNALHDQIVKRPYWCISRQRVWGVPIPVFYNGNEILINESLIQNYCSLLEQHGPDFWWSLSNDQLLKTSSVMHLTKSKDILDIWFDSGLSWSHVLKDKTADVYMEGMDQINGWFMSSLLTSVALKQRSPFQSIFLHGFVVDEKGSKMSKSLGNVISAHDITHGTKKMPAYGVDVLRWWVAAHASKDSTIPIGKNILNSSQEEVQKIRSTLRYLLGVLHDFCPNENNECSRAIDIFMNRQLYNFQNKVNTLYNELQFAKATREISNFVINQLSGLYFSLIKDRVYCEMSNDTGRLSCQHTLNNILLVLLRSIAPILPHLTEEVYNHFSSRTSSSFFQSMQHDISQYMNSETSSVDIALRIREQVNCSIPDNTNKWKLHVTICASPEIHSQMQALLTPKSHLSCDSELSEILQVSSVDVIKSENLVSNEFQTRIGDGSGQHCLRCRRFTIFQSDKELCSRCQLVVDSLKIRT